MINLKEKIIYLTALVIFLTFGISFGYAQTRLNSDLDIDNSNILEYAKNYSIRTDIEPTVAASTSSYDVTVTYEDNYLVCNENTLTSKTIYGTNIDKVKEDEKKYQEEHGLMYSIKAETNTSIIYTRTLNENCPNHFLVILEDEKINVYSIQSETKKTVFMTLTDIYIENLRKELRTKVEKGTYINSRDDLNKFIEDLES